MIIWRTGFRDAVATALRRVFPPDPGGLRLHDAACATTAGVTTLLVTLALARLLPLPPGVEVFGFAASVFVAASVHDDGADAQRVTTLLAFLPMALLTVTASLLVAYPLVLDTILVVLIAAALYAPTFGPRPAALTAVAVTSQLFGVVTRPPLSEVEERLGVLAIAIAAAYAVRFWLWPLASSDVARRISAGLANEIVSMLVPVQEAVRIGEMTPPLRESVSQGMDRLEEAMTLAQSRLGPNIATRPLANHLLDLEFASERVAGAALHGLPADAGDRDAALSGLASVRVGLVSGMPPRAAEALPASGDHLVTQIALLARLIERRQAEPLAATFPTPGPPDKAARRALLLQAIQAAVAVSAAMAMGHVISSSRWYWAAFTTFLVFQGVRSRQDTMVKAWQIAMGTVGGVAVGVLFATLLAHHAYAATVATILAIFLAFYASTAAYGVMIFWITIIIGLVFGMLGYFPPELLALRFEETLLGAACGVLAAFALRLDHTPDTLDAAARRFLLGLRGLVAAAMARLSGGEDRQALEASEPALQQAFIAYAAVALPRLRGLPIAWNQEVRRRLTRYRACNHWARDLAEIASSGTLPDDAATRNALDAEAKRLLTRLDALTAEADGARQAATSDPPASRFAPPTADLTAHQVFRLLLAIEGALAPRPGAGNSGFALGVKEREWRMAKSE
jgi:hypothetical protein